MQTTSAISWSLADLLDGWAQVQAIDANTVISGLSLDSRSSKAGDLFFAVQGLQTHGVEFCENAIANGAAAIAWEPAPNINAGDLPNSVPCVSISNLQQQIGFIAHRFYHKPSEGISVIGVTGTDGKTSVSQFIAQAFDYLDKSCGVIGTLGCGIYPNLGPASHTTPDAIRVQSLLHQYFEADTPYAVIEASSHGLKQGRLNSVVMDTAVFTNLGRDHMDYHLTQEDYANSKNLLFQMPNLKHAIVNIDDEFGIQLANELSKQVNLVTYSYMNFQPEFGTFLYAHEITFTNGKTKFEVNSSWGDFTIRTNLVGNFNVSNILAALGVLLVNDHALNDAIKAISSVHSVSGRMQLIAHINQAPSVIVDYAHTPQALVNVLQVLRDQCEGELWCVFGCGGDRDPGKRKHMANAVEKYADHAIVTDDNPRTEDPEVITKDIISGFSSSAQFTLIHDRQKAIAYAINSAAYKDIVLVAGKGHEAVQIVNDNHIPFDDVKVAQKYLKSYQK